MIYLRKCFHNTFLEEDKMKKVKVISRTKFAEGEKLRVAAYCRVSTSQSEQLDSLENQRIHY